MKTESRSITMTDNYSISLHSWTPEDIEPPKKIVLICHGMAEYAKRYEYLATFLVKNNIACYAHDQRGHGETAGTLENLGFIAEKNGFQRVVLDVNEIVKYLHLKYPNTPIYLLGHSFGSFVSQSYIEQFGSEISGCLLSGTAGPRTILGLLLKFISTFCCTFIGAHKKTYFIHYLAFGNYNKKVKEPKSLNAWISRDDAQVKAYDESPYCGFFCTNSFFKDLGTGLSTIHRKKNLAKIPVDLPIYLFAGTDDPVGSYTKTIKALAKVYRNLGIKSITEKYYENGRHEMFNEINRNEVNNDVLNWVLTH